MRDDWEKQWATLDRRTRARLRRAAFRGRAVDDPGGAALVAAFARSKATERRRLQLAMHVLAIAGITAALVLNVTRRDGDLAGLYGALLVLDFAVLALYLGSRRRLLRAAELNQRIAPD
jgi:hypothetical protein